MHYLPVVVCRKRRSSAQKNLQANKDLGTKVNEAYGTSCVKAPIPLADNSTCTTVRCSATFEGNGSYAINQPTYDLPQTTPRAAMPIATAPNMAYGGVQRQSGDAYDYIIPHFTK